MSSNKKAMDADRMNLNKNAENNPDITTNSPIPHSSSMSGPQLLPSWNNSTNETITLNGEKGVESQSASIVTRKLLMELFPRETLATHSLTGKPSPAFSKPAREQLNPSIVEDIVLYVSEIYHVSRSIGVESQSASIVTRKLLMELFPRETLATHSLTGKPSPAFLGSKPVKEKLNPSIVEDIVLYVSEICHVSRSIVRNCISTKLGGENKMYRKRQKLAEKTSQVQTKNKENHVEKKISPQND
ncbi:Protein insensitive [Pseudolycoriella hygida]|uniref:Protein insensitive n=1 Tax=Pseudolycoriella hygida TaxID=35572 RepID=A0A9Q0S6G6_9DIPT|nr:Protein insensitive [Pseudolycoriella hygida]